MDVTTAVFSGKLLERGFWLYVWEVAIPGGKLLYYVGRTGDSSSANAQSPFNRMGQHLGQNRKSNMLRKYLQQYDDKGIELSHCSFRIVALGPLWEESTDHEEHRRIRDKIAGLEFGFEKSMRESGYEVLNIVRSSNTEDKPLLQEIVAKLSHEFPLLKMRRAHANEDGCE